MRPVTVKEIWACGARLGITQVAGPAGSTDAVKQVFPYAAESKGRTAGAVPPQAVLLFPSGDAWREFLDGRLRRVVPPPGNIPGMALSAPEMPDDLRRYSESAGTPAFASRHDPFLLHSRLTGLLRELGERRVMVHGVLVRVSGRGLLITGESGIGKTASGLALMHSDHCWVADDAVILEARGDALYGRGHERSRDWIAVRGKGILRVEALLGRERLLQETRVDVTVRLTRASGNGVNRAAFRSFVGVSVPCGDLAADMDPGRTADCLLDCVRGLKAAGGDEETPGPLQKGRMGRHIRDGRAHVRAEG